MDTPTSPNYSPVSNIFSMHDDSSARDGFNQPDKDILAKVLYINIVLKNKKHNIYFLQAFNQIDGPDGIPQSVDVNDGPDYFNRSYSPTYNEYPIPSHKRSHSTFTEHPTPVRNVKRRLF